MQVRLLADGRRLAGVSPVYCWWSRKHGVSSNACPENEAEIPYYSSVSMYRACVFRRASRLQQHKGHSFKPKVRCFETTSFVINKNRAKFASKTL